MPHKHIVKAYVENGHYHVYNRGVEKRNIFSDKQDYTVFLHLLKYYLSPKRKDEIHPLTEHPNVTLVRPRPLANLHQEVDLLVYCLMPNHFHLLIKQTTKDGMPKLIRRLITTYVMYFNRRHKRVGPLFQSNYKAALIDKDPYLLHVSRYIHLNPAELTKSDLVNYPYSSYIYYLGYKQAPWIKPNFLLSYFDSSRNQPDLNLYLSYQEFVEINKEDPKETVSHFAID